MDTEFFVGEPTPLVPETYTSPTQRLVFEHLVALDIPFLRVDTGDGTTMEACIPIGEKLGSPVVKTVFVCNRQQTLFWLYVMDPGRPFVTRDFCSALGIARVSFASEEHLVSMLGTPHGATTVLSLLLDKERRVSLVIDRSLSEGEYISCTDGTNTGFLRMKVADLLGRFLPSTGHTPIFI